MIKWSKNRKIKKEKIIQERIRNQEEEFKRSREERKQKAGTYRVYNVDDNSNEHLIYVNFYYFDEDGDRVEETVFLSKTVVYNKNKEELEDYVKQEIESIIKSSKSTKISLIEEIKGKVEL